MKFFTDHYFQIGYTHYITGKPCQDHALSCVYDHGACAVASDGCSSGGSNTDVGARVITLSTQKAISESLPNIHLRQQEIILKAKQLLGLQSEDMLATCLYAYVSEQGGLIHVHGDGLVGLKYSDGRITMTKFEWARNMPFYLGYDEDAKKQFIVYHGADLNAICLKAERALGCADGSVHSAGSTEYTLREGLAGISLRIPQAELRTLDYVAVFTDGVAQIDNVNWREALMTFLAFKTTAGEFAKRRMIRGVKDMRQKGKGPQDDIAIAAIRIEHLENERREDV